MASKSTIRSMRFSDEILSIIDSQEGENFTEKFEGLIYKCHLELPAKLAQIAAAEDRIKSLYEQEHKLRKMTSDLRNKLNNCYSTLDYMDTQIKKSADYLKTCFELE